jgi:transcriptional regulator with XRE-family HTH domain
MGTRRKWSEEEIGILRSLAECELPSKIVSILKNQGFHRTEIAVKIKLRRLGFSTVTTLDNFSASEIARVCQLSASTVSSWIRKRGLKAEPVSSKLYAVRQKDLRTFLKNPPSEIQKSIKKIDEESRCILLGRA